MDKKEALKQIKAKKFSLADADDKLKADKKIVLAAVKQDGYALQYADEKLKGDKEVILAAIKQKVSLLRYADENLKADKEVVLAAVEKDASALDYQGQLMVARLLKGLNCQMNKKEAGIMLSDKLIQKMTHEFDTDNGTIVGDDHRLIMLRDGVISDKEYCITIEKVLLNDEGNAEEYEVLDQFFMKHNDKETMKEATESYLGHASKLNLTDGKYCDEYGGTVEYLENFFR